MCCGSVEWVYSTEMFTESNIITHYTTLRLSLDVAKAYERRFFSKNGGALS